MLSILLIVLNDGLCTPSCPCLQFYLLIQVNFLKSLFNYDNEVIYLRSSGVEFCYSYIKRLVRVEIK